MSMRLATILNLDAPPSLLHSGRWHVPEKDHRQMGCIQWDQRRFVLYQTPLLRSGMIGIHGSHILKELRKFPRMPLLNANALDFLLERKGLIPPQCKDYYVYFWGTIYHEYCSDRFVRHLWWDAEKHTWSHGDTLVDGFGWSRSCAIATYIGLF